MNGLPWTVPGGQQVQFTPYQIAGRGGGTAMVAGNGQLASQGFEAGSIGWCIYGDGSVEFNSGNFRGDITGASGTFSGVVAASSLQIGGDDATSFQVDSGGGIWSGASIANKATAPFRVSNAGALVATSGTFTGGTYTGTGTLSNNAANTFQSGNFVSGTSGWQIKGDGNAEFQGVVARGTIRTGLSGARVDVGFSDAAAIIFDHGVAFTGNRPYLLAQDNVGSGSMFLIGPEQANDNMTAYISLVGMDDGSYQAIELVGDYVSVTGQVSTGNGAVGSPPIAVGALDNGIYASNDDTVDISGGGVRVAAFYSEGEVNYQDGIMYDGIGGTHFVSFYYDTGISKLRGVVMSGGSVVVDAVLH